MASSTAAEGGKGSGLSELFGKHKLSQRFGADLATQQQAQVGLTSCRCVRNVLAVPRLVLVSNQHQMAAPKYMQLSSAVDLSSNYSPEIITGVTESSDLCGA